ncbi:unnamed protein product [Rangifer tarandus platyrhynchus]|uniref:Uncharacterized protein n=2 Tax=Rangifer tarandus platyrhynchus TaxID=3082113 RepID=A0ABN8YFQ9_RANTA|nr:unnamed protein product [Rangifer tarandus platyrhynchus]
MGQVPADASPQVRMSGRLLAGGAGRGVRETPGAATQWVRPAPPPHVRRREREGASGPALLAVKVNPAHQPALRSSGASADLQVKVNREALLFSERYLRPSLVPSLKNPEARFHPKPTLGVGRPRQSGIQVRPGHIPGEAGPANRGQGKERERGQQSRCTIIPKCH